jgi:hypothetical protein
MAQRNGHTTRTDSQPPRREMEVARVASLGELDDYKVADDEPDPRGWHVLTRESTRAGEVADLIVDLAALKVCYLEVELDKDALRLRANRHVLVPVGAAWLNEDEQIVRVGLTTTELIAAPAYDPRSFSATNEEALRQRYAGHLTRSEEDLAVGTRRRMVGKVVAEKRAVPKEEVVIEKRSVPDEKTVAADLKKERLDVERR